MKKGQRPSRHIRNVRTNRGRRRVLVNPSIRKKRSKPIKKKRRSRVSDVQLIDEAFADNPLEFEEVLLRKAKRIRRRPGLRIRRRETKEEKERRLLEEEQKKLLSEIEAKEEAIEEPDKIVIPVEKKETKEEKKLFRLPFTKKVKGESKGIKISTDDPDDPNYRLIDFSETRDENFLDLFEQEDKRQLKSLLSEVDQLEKDIRPLEREELDLAEKENQILQKEIAAKEQAIAEKREKKIAEVFNAKKLRIVEKQLEKFQALEDPEARLDFLQKTIKNPKTGEEKDVFDVVSEAVANAQITGKKDIIEKSKNVKDKILKELWVAKGELGELPGLDQKLFNIGEELKNLPKVTRAKKLYVIDGKKFTREERIEYERKKKENKESIERRKQRELDRALELELKEKAAIEKAEAKEARAKSPKRKKKLEIEAKKRKEKVEKEAGISKKKRDQLKRLRVDLKQKYIELLRKKREREGVLPEDEE